MTTGLLPTDLIDDAGEGDVAQTVAVCQDILTASALAGTAVSPVDGLPHREDA
jgi:hypothetical protein